MPLTILNVAYPLATVGPNAVGGAEQVVSLLDRELTQAGHHSIVIAREGSECDGTLIALPGLRGTLQHHLQPAAQLHCRDAITAALRRWPIDLVHLHGLDFPAYLPPPGPPVLVTLHLPPAWYAEGALFARRPRTYLHCVSPSQRAACPPALNLLPEIENGVPTDDLFARHGKRRYVISLGRICWEKGFHLALDAAAAAGIGMLLGGQVFPYAQHEAYFREMILPRLATTRRFVGPVGFRRKRRLLTAARALLVPSLVPETGSLVAMEALACGTPVIAFRSGALRSVVEHGVTGFLVDDVHEMTEAIHAAGGIDPRACRDAAVRRFSVERMREQYFSLYQRLAETTEETRLDAAPSPLGSRGRTRERGAIRAGAAIVPVEGDAEQSYAA